MSERPIADLKGPISLTPTSTDVLTYRFASINVKVTGGNYGSPFRYARASFFTMEQVQLLTERKKTQLRGLADERRMFLGPHEWEDVFDPLWTISHYVGVPFLPGVRAGDTGLSISIRILRFKAACCFLDQGIDALTHNVAGESAADLLQTQLKGIREELEIIEALHIKALSHLSGGLDDNEQARVKRQSFWEHKLTQINEVAARLVDRSGTYLNTVTYPLKLRASRAVIEGIKLTATERQEIDREDFLTRFLAVSREVFAITAPVAVPDDFDPLALERRRRNTLATRIEAWWRGYWYRLSTRRARRTKAAYRIQLFFKFVAAWARHGIRTFKGQKEAFRSTKADLSAGILALLGISQDKTVGKRGAEVVRRTSEAAATTVRDLLRHSRQNSLSELGESILFTSGLQPGPTG